MGTKEKIDDVIYERENLKDMYHIQKKIIMGLFIFGLVIGVIAIILGFKVDDLTKNNSMLKNEIRFNKLLDDNFPDFNSQLLLKNSFVVYCDYGLYLQQYTLYSYEDDYSFNSWIAFWLEPDDNCEVIK